ncbi:MAG: protein kinase, partial [candidate division KSB1 bacterium]|nr:protein kinase [candidate division KSB1 bacterium]
MADLAENKTRLLQLLQSLGRAYLDSGNYDEAIKKYQKLIELGMEDAVVYRDLSQAYLMKKRFDPEALRIYQKALSLEPENKILTLVLSQNFLRTRRKDDAALQIYLRALRFRPEFARQLWLLVTKIFLERGEPEKAWEQARTALANAGKSTETLFYFLSLSWKLGKYDETIKQLKRIIRRTNDRQALKALCLTYLERNSAQKEPSYLNTEDTFFCLQFLNSMGCYKNLDELLLYLDVRSLALASGLAEPKKADTLNEYELLLSEKPLDVLWTQQWNYEKDFLIEWDFRTDVWKRLRVVKPLEAKEANFQLLWPEQAQESTTVVFPEKDQLKNLRALLALKISNYQKLISRLGEKAAHKIINNFFSSVFSQLKGDKQFLVYGVDDGLILFFQTIPEALSFSLEILTKDKTEADEKERLHINISLHHSLSDYDKDFQDLRIVLKINRIKKNHLSDKEKNKAVELLDKDRILLSEQAYQEIGKTEGLVIRCVGAFPLKYFPDNFRIYQATPARYQPGVDHLKFGRFEVIDQLRHHKIYSVYRGRDTLLERLVIIKAIASDLMPEQKLLKEQFLQEARNVGKLNHRNIVIIYDVGEQTDFSYLAREYCEGKNLKELLETENIVTNKRLVEIMLQVCQALDHAHRCGVFHGNIKPTNIIVSPDGETKLTDFGLVNHFLNSGNEAKQYTPPEQWGGAKTCQVDARSDIFSLGVVLYESLTGKNPLLGINYDAFPENILQDQALFPSSLNPELPE